MANDYIVKPVYKALQVFVCLGEARRPLTLTEICARVRLPKTTVFRYLYTLREAGLVTHNPTTDLYQFSLRVWELGQLADERPRIGEIALPFMRQLRDRFNETINLAILDDKEVVFLDTVESRHAVLAHVTPGSRYPAYCMALGKAMLAFMPEEQWRRHVPPRLSPRTSTTITSLTALKQDLQSTRERGYALNQGENEEDACCVGAPIFDQSGQVLAAVSLSAPGRRLYRALDNGAAAAVMQTVAAISQRLGYRGEPVRAGA